MNKRNMSNIYCNARSWTKPGMKVEVKSDIYFSSNHFARGDVGIIEADGCVRFPHVPYVLFGNSSRLPACVDDSCGKCFWCNLRPHKSYKWKKL